MLTYSVHTNIVTISPCKYTVPVNTQGLSSQVKPLRVCDAWLMVSLKHEK